MARSSRGFTLLEAMLVVAVLGVVSLAVSIGLASASHTPENTDRVLAISDELVSELEKWRSCAFGASPWPSTLPYTLTDTVTLSVGGQSLTYPRTTTITNWDPQNLSSNASPQTDFVQVQVTIGGRSLTEYLTKPI